VHSFIDTIAGLDGQTDGRICHNSIALCMHCVLTRDKIPFKIPGSGRDSDQHQNRTIC